MNLEPHCRLYEPEEIVGRKVGIESNGMIVAGSLEGGKPVLAGFLENIPVGARLKQMNLEPHCRLYKPEEIVGRIVGIESNGMIVAGSLEGGGKPVLAGFLENIPVGARLK